MGKIKVRQFKPLITPKTIPLTLQTANFTKTLKSKNISLKSKKSKNKTMNDTRIPYDNTKNATNHKTPTQIDPYRKNPQENFNTLLDTHPHTTLPHPII